MVHPGLWLCGPTGVGKSTVAYEIFVAIHRAGRKVAYVDADQVGMCYPAPSDDTHNHSLKALNVGAVWRNFRAADALSLIVSGAIRSDDELQLYREQLTDVSLLVCRLSIGEEELRARLGMRSAGYGPPVPGRTKWRTAHPESVREAIHELPLLEKTTFADLIVETDGLSPIDVALRVREQAGGWLTPLS
jgi:hypothetical protein